MHNVHSLLATVPFFNSASSTFLSDIVTKLKFEVFLPGEYICTRGRKGDKMFFIQRGIVDILTKDNTLATSLGDGSHFGGKKYECVCFRRKVQGRSIPEGYWDETSRGLEQRVKSKAS